LPSRHPCQNIVDELRASIADGWPAAGERLPSANKLTEQYGPSRPTVLRTVYDADGAAVEVQETIAAADKHEFPYEVAMR
jgi:GntR family transcriptional regulator